MRTNVSSVQCSTKPPKETGFLTHFGTPCGTHAWTHVGTPPSYLLIANRPAPPPPLPLLRVQEELEIRRQLLVRVEAVAEVYAAHAAVGVQLQLLCLGVVRAVGSLDEVAEVEDDHVPEPEVSCPVFCICCFLIPGR